METPIDRVDEKLTTIAVNCGCVGTADIVQFVRDLYRGMTADDNHQILADVSRTGVGTVHKLLKNAREIQRELGNDNARRAEVRAKEEAKEKAEKPKPKAKSAGNAEAPA